MVEMWIPVVVAVLGLVTTLLAHYGKVKHADALKKVIEAIENADKEGIIKKVVKNTTFDTKAGAIISDVVRSIGG